MGWTCAFSDWQATTIFVPRNLSTEQRGTRRNGSHPPGSRPMERHTFRRFALNVGGSGRGCPGGDRHMFKCQMRPVALGPPCVIWPLQAASMERGTNGSRQA